MIGVEIDFVVQDSISALALYEKIFDVEVIEVSNLSVGENEAVFTIYGTCFHILDENPEFNIYAPKADQPVTMWMNVSVPNIHDTFDRALEAGCQAVQDIVELPEYGVSNASFMDPYGYHWMLHQVHEVVSHKDRIQLWENRNE